MLNIKKPYILWFFGTLILFTFTTLGFSGTVADSGKIAVAELVSATW